MKPIRVGFLSAKNYFDRNTWSGTLYQMYRALKNTELEIVEIGNPQKPSVINKLLQRLQPQKAPPLVGSPAYLKKYQEFAATVHNQLKHKPCDVIFAPVADSELFFMATEIPIVYLSDVTAELHQKYYPVNLKSQSIEWKYKAEGVALSKCKKIIYSSDWAAKSAREKFNLEPDKVKVIPFGANVDVDDIPSLEEINLNRKSPPPCRLLFIGRNWERKGGNIALDTFSCLQKIGIPTKLTIIGSKPPNSFQSEDVTVIPFLDKNISEQRQRFKEILLKSHFFIFPTRADCSPIVTCEANAFGLPVITTDVGGIPTIIREGKNGYMLPLSATGDDFAQLIATIISQPNKYEQLVVSSRAEYQERLNWDKWAETVYNVIVSVCRP